MNRLSKLMESPLKNLIRRIKDFYRDNLTSIVLFSSCGRGELSVSSDIDLLIILDHSKFRPRERISEFFEHIADTLEIGDFILPVSPTICTKSEARNFHPIYLSMVHECVVLYDKQGFFKRILQYVQGKLKQGDIEEYHLKGTTYLENKERPVDDYMIRAFKRIKALEFFKRKDYADVVLQCI